MIARCFNPNSFGYELYGAVGITVCDRWRKFPAFLKDMGVRPSLGHSIDRFPNGRGNYEPGNCRWATRKEQSRNLHTNRILTFNGKTQCLTDNEVGKLFFDCSKVWTEEIRAFVQRFDRGFKPQPFSFEMDIPEEALTADARIIALLLEL